MVNLNRSIPRRRRRNGDCGVDDFGELSMMMMTMEEEGESFVSFFVVIDRLCRLLFEGREDWKEERRWSGLQDRT